MFMKNMLNLMFTEFCSNQAVQVESIHCITIHISELSSYLSKQVYSIYNVI